ncbi:sugar phosphate nucleotidyltransferase [Polaribacter sp.]|uniref:sugar phosphate nucleotidyltransferase n=1 Tax=Polaribacter sp. TaxID=1920175 RepID=UPI004048683B
MHDNLIILAGGMSSRMKKNSTSNSLSKEEEIQANERSKSLISVGNDGRPLLDYLLFNAKKAGYKNIFIVINEKATLFKELYGQKKENNPFHDLSISFAIQYIPENREKPFGTADAVFQTVEQFPELNHQQYTICNSDNLYSEKSLKILRETKNKNAFISYDRDALHFSTDKILGFAVMNLDSENYLKSIIEKPSEAIANKHKDSLGKIRVSMNIFKFDGESMFSYLKNCPVNPVRNEKELPTVVLNRVKDDSKAFLGIPISEHVPDLTSKEDISTIKEYLKNHYPKNLSW